MCLFDVYLISVKFQYRVSPAASNPAINLWVFYELLLREKFCTKSKAAEAFECVPMELTEEFFYAANRSVKREVSRRVYFALKHALAIFECLSQFQREK